jgi:hypothetical protein
MSSAISVGFSSKLYSPVEKCKQQRQCDRQRAAPSFRKHFVSSVPQQTGFSTSISHHKADVSQLGGATGLAWLTAERIAETRRVWSPVYGRIISEDEAVDILRNVRRLAAVLVHANDEELTHECRGMGAGLFP